MHAVLVDVVASGRLPGAALAVIDRAVDEAARRAEAGRDLTRCEASGKLRHESEIAARRFARLIHRRGRQVASRPYPCEGCGGWHLATVRRRAA